MNTHTLHGLSRILMVGLVLVLLGTVLASAYPPLPTEFYGEAKYYGTNVSVGIKITAHGQGTTCGSFTVQDGGHYGLLTCRGNDTETSVSEGPMPGGDVYFRINGLNAYAVGDTNWSSGSFKDVDLYVPIPFCGDNFCDPFFETCDACVQDCGVCTGGETNGTGGTGGTGGDTGGGGGVPGESTGGAVSPIFGVCTESWRCSDWSNCSLEGLQYRTCTDLNACGTVDHKPAETQECDYTPTCSDGVQNGDETGVDCGGSCGPCETCSDGIKNQGEEDIDCGGPCAACPTCFDGYMNQGEEGVDCGGPCEKECPIARPPLLQLPTAVCEKQVNLLDPYFLMFLLVIVLAIILRIVYAEYRIHKIKQDKKLDDLAKAKKWLSARRQMYLFIITISVLVVFILLYAYFFFLCPTDFLTYLWILLAALLVSPLIVHRVMRFYEYNEIQTLKRLGRIFDAHYQQIQQLVTIQNEHLMEIEQRLAQKLYAFSSDPTKKLLLDKHPDLNGVYRDVVKLYEQYHLHKNPFAMEKDLCERIYRLSEDKRFTALAEKLPDIKEIYGLLRLLYEQYEEKQKLYDEMDQIEHPEKYQEKQEKESTPDTLQSVDGKQKPSGEAAKPAGDQPAAGQEKGTDQKPQAEESAKENQPSETPDTAKSEDSPPAS